MNKGSTLQRLVFFSIIGLFFTLIVPSYMEAKTVEERIVELESEQGKVKLLQDRYESLTEETKDYRKYLKEEADSFEDFVRGERDAVYDMYMLSIGLLTLIGTGTIVAANLNNSSLRKKLADDLERDLTKIREGEQENILQQLGKVKNELVEQSKVEFQNLLQAESAQLKQKVATLENIVERELAYQQVKILVIGDSHLLDEMKTKEIDMLEKAKLNHIKCKEFDEEVLREHVANNDFDILVYRYKVKDNEQDPRVRTVASMLIEANRSIPFIIYTHGSSNVTGEDKLEVNKYVWTMMANFPTTLASNLFTLVHSSMFRKQDQDL